MLGAILLIALFGVLVVDLGMMFSERRAAQSAADLAALAAAQDLPTRANDPQFDARIETAAATALSFLAANGYDGAAETAVGVTTSYAGDPTKIEVSAGRTVHWLFGNLLGLPDPSVEARAVAAANAQPRDVALVLDRSGSMCIDTHGGPMLTCPNPPGDPDGNGVADWEPFDTMREAATAFGEMLTPTAFGSGVLDRMSLVSFSTDATLDLALTNDFLAGSPYTSAIAAMAPAGYTNTGAAMLIARQELDQYGRNESARILVVLSDGYANRYRSGGSESSPTYSTCSSATGCGAADDDVLAQAHLAAAEGYQIYTIGYTNRAGAALLQAVADIGADEGGGGQFFAVDDPQQLQDTFEQISELTSVALIE